MHACANVLVLLECVVPGQVLNWETSNDSQVHSLQIVFLSISTIFPAPKMTQQIRCPL